MRAWIGVAVIFSCFAFGCDDDTATNPTQDLSMPVIHDMTALFGTQTCLQVITCASGCAGSAACQGNCAAMGTMAAQTKYQALGQCAVTGCLGPGDGGVIPCSSATDTGMACQDCIAAYAQGPNCSTQLNACLSDH